MRYYKWCGFVLTLFFIAFMACACQLAGSRVPIKPSRQEKSKPLASKEQNVPKEQDASKEQEVPLESANPVESSSPVETKEEEGNLDQSKEIEMEPTVVNGIYVTGPRAGSAAMEDLIALVDQTKINAMVIDIKNDAGEVTYKMDEDTVNEIKAAKNYVPDMPALIQKLKKKNIYLIARIVAFKDPRLAEEKPELALKNKNGTIFRDKDKLAWVNPYQKEVWDYLLSIAKQAVLLGFDEIQFDYIRFSTDKKMKDVDFGALAKQKSKEEIITEFTQYMHDELSALGVFVSADVYGIVINSEVDQEIVGQNYKDMAENLDYICPMIYPSHYADGSFGIEHPDLEPYELIKKALDDSALVLKDSKKAAIVRPWLQDFTASWLPHHQTYGKEQVEAQIQALEDAGYNEWLLWNGSNHYTTLDD
ncbi:MAG: hypothetical protein PWP24_460 [Clostridiales bacterium]|nr:hypothetical protein [Clostridiales bacterium]